MLCSQWQGGPSSQVVVLMLRLNLFHGVSRHPWTTMPLPHEPLHRSVESVAATQNALSDSARSPCQY